MEAAAEHWGRVRDLLGEALELAGPAQLHFLDTIEDCALRTEVKAYLAYGPLDGAGQDPLESQPWGGIVRVPVQEGSRLANYRLLKELGSGGMGTVYLAERDDREFEQRVAIKVIQHRLQSEEVVRLFRRERQILATLNHPSIARLVDGGVTTEGKPFFVMEYVDGIPIDAYCRSHKLSMRDRLKLFLPVCDAVQFAHQNLVVHRDLKPSNILVTANGVPKLIDFGVAQLLHEQPADMHTLARLTPRYASPEHARGEASGTATDIYSLGVLLFELLTESLPLARASPADFLRALEEEVPVRPSALVVDRSQRREVSGDLDNIVLHALEKLPARRYSSVENFGADIRRHLKGFPVLARPASWSYSSGKYIRRHRTLAGAAAVLLVIGSLSIGAVLRSRNVAEHQRALAQLRFEQGRELARFYILEVDRLLEKLPGSTPARALITGHTLAYLDRLVPGAAGDIPLQRELATAYERVAMSQGMPIFANMGNHSGALANVEKGIRVREQILTSPLSTLDDRISYGDILLLLGHLKLNGGNPATAAEVYLHATHEFEAVLARSAHPAGRLLSRLGSAYMYTGLANAGTGTIPDCGNAEAALPLFQKAVSLIPLERKARENQAPLLRTYLLSNEALIQLYWGAALTQLLRHAEAEQHYVSALQLIHSPGIDTANAEITRKEGAIELSYSFALVQQGAVKAATPHLALAARILTGLWSIDPQNVTSQQDISILKAVQGKLKVASGNYQSGIASLDLAILDEKRMLLGDPDFSLTRSNLSQHYLWAADGWVAAGNADRARARYSQAFELAAATVKLHPDDANTQIVLASSAVGLARAFAAKGNRERTAHFRELAVDAMRNLLKDHHDHPRARVLLTEAVALAP